MRDPYEVLGVSRTADEGELKKAFRRSAKLYHPDRNRDDPRAKDRFAELNTAYEILGDTAKRSAFDRGEIDAEGKPRFQGFGGRAGAQPAGAGGREGFESFSFGFGGGPGRAAGRGKEEIDMSDIFSSFFGDAAGANARPKGRKAAAQGEDLSIVLTVTLEDIVGSKARRVTLPNGREVDVSLPLGVTDGQVIRLRGLGEQSPFGGEPGDALMTVRIASHPLFTVEGSTVRLRLSVPLADAVLGGKIRVPTLAGEVDITIPPMTSSGRSLRLRGKGLPAKGGVGDLIATVEIALPKQADPELDALMKRMRAEV